MLVAYTWWMPMLPVFLLSEVTASRAWWVVAGLVLFALLVRCLRAGLILTEVGLLIRNPFRTTNLRWEDIRRIEPARGPDAPSDRLVAVTAQGRHRIAITMSADRRGDELLDALRAVLGAQHAKRLVGFRPPPHPAWWSRSRTNWQPTR